LDNVRSIYPTPDLLQCGDAGEEGWATHLNMIELKETPFIQFNRSGTDPETGSIRDD
jgi:hypothetical protein